MSEERRISEPRRADADRRVFDEPESNIYVFDRRIEEDRRSESDRRDQDIK